MLSKWSWIYLGFLAVILGVGLATFTVWGRDGQEDQWTRQFGTQDDDTAED